jgi:hypothetical protein
MKAPANGGLDGARIEGEGLKGGASGTVHLPNPQPVTSFLNGSLPSEALGLLSHDSPVVSRLLEHSLCFGIAGLCSEFVAFGGLGTEIVGVIHHIQPY